MRYHLFQKVFGKMVKIKETSSLSTRGMTLMFGNCMSSLMKFLYRDHLDEAIMKSVTALSRYFASTLK